MRRLAAARLAATAAALAALLLTASSASALSPFFVFFDSGSTRLSAQARAILDSCAEQARAMDVRELVVEASADRVGAAAHNLRLSRRRGEAVKAYLAGRGYPAERIRVVANGEAVLLVETPDGVAEPQNRYVAVYFARVCRPPPGFEASPGWQPSPGC